MILTGSYQYPQQAEKHAACIELLSHSSMIILKIDGVVLESINLSEISVSEALGSLPVNLYFPNGGIFNTTENENKLLVEWLAKWKKPSRIHRLEKHKYAILLSLIAITLFSFSYFKYILPATSQLLANQVPNKVQQYIGKNSLDLLDRLNFKPSKIPAEEQVRLKAIFQQIQPPQLKEESLPLRLEFRYSSLGANAFTLADGTIIVTDDLVKLVEHDDELIAVLFHEMGHHHYRHIMHTLVRSSLITISISWLIGDASGIEEILLDSGAALLTLNFSRDMEREADQFAIQHMQQQKRSLAMMHSIFAKLAPEEAEKDPSSAFLSTHPDWNERLKTIQQVTP